MTSTVNSFNSQHHDVDLENHGPPIATVPFHVSCRRCHHFHIAKPIKLFNVDVHVQYPCDSCRKPLFGVGRTSTRVSLASELTSASWDINRSLQSSENLNNFNHRQPSIDELVRNGSEPHANGSVVHNQTSTVSRADGSNGTVVERKEGQQPATSRRLRLNIEKVKTAFRRFKPNRHESKDIVNGYQTKPRSKPEMISIGTMTEPFLSRPPASRALPSPRINTQRTIEEAGEETSPLAAISTDVFKDESDERAKLDETDETAARLHAARSEYGTKKRARLRFAYQEHCNGCRCRQHQPPSEISSPVPAVTTSNLLMYGPSTRPSETTSSDSRAVGFRIDSDLPRHFMSDHLDPRPASSSSISGQSMRSALSTATTVLDRRSSIQSRRTNSLPTGALEFMAFTERVRPDALTALRAYDVSQQQQAAQSQESLGNTLRPMNRGAQSNRLRGRSPLRNTTLAPTQEDEGAFAHIGAHSNGETTPRQADVGRGEDDGMAAEIEALSVLEGRNGRENG